MRGLVMGLENICFLFEEIIREINTRKTARSRRYRVKGRLGKEKDKS